jgi:hypothetical protein
VPGMSPTVHEGEVARRLIDGDGSDGYNAVLALYGSCAEEVVNED